ERIGIAAELRLRGRPVIAGVARLPGSRHCGNSAVGKHAPDADVVFVINVNAAVGRKLRASRLLQRGRGGRSAVARKCPGAIARKSADDAGSIHATDTMV